MHAGFELETDAATAAHDITDRVRAIVSDGSDWNGLCLVSVLHTTAAVVVNEFADPNIGRDILDALGRTVPENGNWLHDQIDDNAHSHIKAAILGSSKTIPVAAGELVLGKWQRILLLEFDGPRSRSLHVQLVATQR
jgi:secondary thiamine-phosphate synthase enzyme